MGFTVLSVVALGFLIINEKYHEHPILNLSLFRDASFTSGSVIIFFVFLNLFGSIVILPIFLQTLMGYTSYPAGLVLGPGGIAALLAMPVAGKVVTLVNPKEVLAAGGTYLQRYDLFHVPVRPADRFLDLRVAKGHPRDRDGVHLHSPHDPHPLPHPCSI